jgi:hypothetical protein
LLCVFNRLSGGQLIFEFETPVYIDKIGVLDVEDEEDSIIVETTSGTTIHKAESLGPNSFQFVHINKPGVTRITYDLFGSGATSGMNICDFTPPPAPVVDAPSSTVVGPHGGRKVETIPLQGLGQALTNRLTKAAHEFKDVTATPTAEGQSGVIIYLDPVSTAIAKTSYKNYILASGTNPSSVCVLTSPLCRSANLASGEPCMEYAEELVTQLKSDFDSLIDHAAIKFEVSCSTAGIMSRLIRSKVMLCPPGSPSCLIPAMVKPTDTKAILLETPTDKIPTDWFSYLGFDDKIILIEVPAADANSPADGPTTARGSLKTTNGEIAADIFYAINDAVTGEGYPEGSTVPQTTSIHTAFEANSTKILQDMEGKLALTASGKYVKKRARELVPGTETLRKYALEGKPYPGNYKTPTKEKLGGSPALTKELGKESDTNVKPPPFSRETYLRMVKLRDASVRRIQYDIYQSRLRNKGVAVDPSLQMEVECPTVTDAGIPITYTGDGTVISTHGDGTATVSTGAGTATLTSTSMAEREMTLARDANHDPVTVILDPVTGKNVTVHGKDVVYNDGSGVAQVRGVGAMSYESTDHKVTIITDGGTGAASDTSKQTKYTGTSVTTGSGATPGGAVVRSDGGYAKRSGDAPDDEFRGFAKTPLSLNDAVTDKIAYDGTRPDKTEPETYLNQKKYNYYGKADGRSKDKGHDRRQMETFILDKKSFNHQGHGQAADQICHEVRNRQMLGNMDGIYTPAQVAAAQALAGGGEEAFTAATGQNDLKSP